MNRYEFIVLFCTAQRSEVKHALGGSEWNKIGEIQSLINQFPLRTSANVSLSYHQKVCLETRVGEFVKGKRGERKEWKNESSLVSASNSTRVRRAPPEKMDSNPIRSGILLNITWIRWIRQEITKSRSCERKTAKCYYLEVCRVLNTKFSRRELSIVFLISFVQAIPSPFVSSTQNFDSWAYALRDRIV